MQLPLDHTAIVGYSLILIVIVSQLPAAMANMVDFAASIFLIIGLSALITYHVRKIAEGIDETTADSQKYIRALAHSTIVASLTLTLTKLSSFAFQFYDGFALIAHVILLVTVLNGMSQLAGVGLLAVYFLFASYHVVKDDISGLDLVMLAGRVIMLIFFTISFVLGVSSPASASASSPAEEEAPVEEEFYM